MGHRGGFNYGQLQAGLHAAGGPAATPVDPRHFRGYSYLLGEPDSDSRSSLGANPGKARVVLQALYDLLPMAATADNPRIPSGYTYLLQLVAHDIVDTTVPFWAAAEAGVPSRNMRGQMLGFDTIYGGGPTVCPMAFEPAGSMVDYRTQLRLGQTGDAAQQGVSARTCPARDLARLKLDKAPPPSNFEDASQVYAADVRNDDNTLLSQIVVLFSIVHNAIAAKLAHLGPQACFAHASTAVLRMYHAIIRQDLMPRLLHPAVSDRLNARTAGSDGWLWRGEAVPLEFSHGAFRVGHAMVRPFYQFNSGNRFGVAEMIGGPVLGDPVRDPLPAIWIVEWSRFFELGGSPPNYSLKLAIHQQLPLDFEGIFNPIASNSPVHLTVRDWLSAANARMWRLDKLLDAARTHYPELSFMGAPAIGQWLADLVRTSLGTAADKATIAQNAALLQADLPLPLYILLESQLDPQIAGSHMGPLGSVIVGETIFRRLAIEEERLASLIPAASQELAADWDKIQAVASMPDLVRLAEDWGGLKNCQIPFIAA